MKRWTLCVLLLCAVSACASPRNTANRLVRDSGWQWQVISAGRFDLAAAQPVDRQGHTLWVYLEGDGMAYLAPTRPSSDPTPTDPIALRMALAQPGNQAVAYLARPCQYIPAEYYQGCMQDYWTNARYAPVVIDSINQAIETLKAQAKASRVVLVGYSGGGALAVLVAAHRNDVAGIITVVANLDVAYWMHRNGLTPLTGSLDPADVAGKVATIPQVHFTGGRDKVVGTDVLQEFVNRLPARAPVQVIEMPDFNHTCCWADNWHRLITSPATKSIIVFE